MSREESLKISQSKLAKMAEAQKRFSTTVTKDDLLDDLRRLQAEAPFSNITRDYYRSHSALSEKQWTRVFGNFQEFKRQAGLEPTRDQNLTNHLRVAKNASLVTFRKFMQEDVLPYHNKYQKSPKNSRYATLVVGSDFHDKQSDPFVLGAFIRTCEMIQPDVIVLNGDIFDNYEFSRYDVDWAQVDIKGSWDFVQSKIFEPLRRVCPNSQIDLIIGNHEWRILKLLASEKISPVKTWLSECLEIDLAKWFGLDKYQINLISKLDLSAYNKKDVTKELRENFKVYYGCFVAAHIKDYGFGMSGTSGHTHRPSLSSSSNLALGNTSWLVTGCIKKTNAEYVEGPNKWTNGFSIVHIDKEEKKVQQVPILIPGNSVVIEGVRMTRSEFNV